MQSSLQRAALLEQLRSDVFDLVVIGGGITGAGIALDASSRGLKTALVEKSDFASGTSSRSTKLIHGGLRYLKQLEIALVREVGRERATVHRLAPHLVRPEKMLLPLVEGGTYGKLATNMGLWVYDVLAGVTGEDKRKMLTREETIEREPLLRKDILVGAGYYAEYRTDDARLTIENVKTAIQNGALCINYVDAVDFQYNAEGQIEALRCHDLPSDEPVVIKTKGVISAAGPWVDELRKQDASLQGKHLFLSKGVHIVVPHERLPVKQAVYFDVPDGRMIFAIPRGRVTYIGTTDTPYDGDTDNVLANLDDVQYLLDATNQMFPSVDLQPEDVESSWAGLRPLIHEEGKSASQMSRKDEIFESDSGLLSIAGGKLTGYRKMSERVVDRLVKRLEERHGQSVKPSRTAKLPLVGGPFQNEHAVTAYEQEIAQLLTQAKLPADRAWYLVSNFGRQSEQIIELAAMYTNLSDGTQRLAAAEARFSIEAELAVHPLDYVNRRSGRLYFDLPSIEPILDTILEVFADLLGYSAAETSKQRQEVETAMHELGHFTPAKA